MSVVLTERTTLNTRRPIPTDAGRGETVLPAASSSSLRFCGECQCPSEIGEDRFWVHSCKHPHPHVVPFVIGADRRWMK